MDCVSKRVIDFLGREILGIMQNPDRVESYRVKILRSDKGTRIAGYPVIGRGRDLVPKQIEMLQSVFFDDGTYLFDVVKKCLFLPEYALRIVKGEDVCIILLCFSCEEVKFVHNDRELLEDFDPSTKKLRALIDPLFLDQKE